MSYELVFDVQTGGLRLSWLALLPIAELLFGFILAGALTITLQTRKKLNVFKIVIPVALLKVLPLLNTQVNPPKLRETICSVRSKNYLVPILEVQG